MMMSDRLARAGTTEGHGGGRIRLAGGSKASDEGAPASNTTSMIDVIFILLVFFVSISQLKDSRVKVDVPSAKGTSEPDRPDDIEKLNIAITADNTVFFQDQEIAIGPDLNRAIEKIVKESGTEVKVTIHSDASSTSGTMLKVLGFLSHSGLTKVEFAVKSDGND